ncbi:hypothetical protein ASA1KI_10900 [Opitutales bacterium ASA1]|uniref:hypothetical protein n=1 Tax=Congregicoccus parvus TaxID=3081749 RepID=UPI002B2E613C|nr:hypothetical protein ASA1KI_10900 [Opitutales bacterium ASA1]
MHDTRFSYVQPQPAPSRSLFQTLLPALRHAYGLTVGALPRTEDGSEIAAARLERIAEDNRLLREIVRRQREELGRLHALVARIAETTPSALTTPANRSETRFDVARDA